MSPALIGIGRHWPSSTVPDALRRGGDPVRVRDTPVIFLTGDNGVAPLSLTAFIIAVTILLGLVIGSMVTDVRGLEEDRRARVRTVYTNFGLDRE